jgi:hypothetical protein
LAAAVPQKATARLDLAQQAYDRRSEPFVPIHSAIQETLDRKMSNGRKASQTNETISERFEEGGEAASITS